MLGSIVTLKLIAVIHSICMHTGLLSTHVCLMCYSPKWHTIITVNEYQRCATINMYMCQWCITCSVKVYNCSVFLSASYREGETDLRVWESRQWVKQRGCKSSWGLSFQQDFLAFTRLTGKKMVYAWQVKLWGPAGCLVLSAVCLVSQFQTILWGTANDSSPVTSSQHCKKSMWTFL